MTALDGCNGVTLSDIDKHPRIDGVGGRARVVSRVRVLGVLDPEQGTGRGFLGLHLHGEAGSVSSVVHGHAPVQPNDVDWRLSALLDDARQGKIIPILNSELLGLQNDCFRRHHVKVHELGHEP